MKAILSATRALLLFTCFVMAGCGNDPVPVPQGEGSFLIYTFLEQNDFDKIELFVDGILKGTLTERVSGTMPCTTETSAFAVKIRMLATKKYNFEARRYKNGNEVGSWTKKNAELEVNTCQRLALQ